MEKVLMTKETVKVLGDKLKFSNKIFEALDDTALNMLNKLIFNKIAEKLSDEVLQIVTETLKTVIEEMPEIKID